MDPGEYDSNTLLINNVSSVSFRVYEPATLSSAYTFAASDVERALRNDGHLVYADAIRRGIWCFYLVGKEGSSLSQSPPPSLGPSLDVCGYKLSLVDEGGFEPVSLLKSRPVGTGTNSMNTPNSSSSAGSALETAGRAAQSFNSSVSLHSMGFGLGTGVGAGAGAGAVEYEMKHDSAKGYSTVPVKEMYEYFVSAILSSLSSAFCARVGAIALNARSLLLPSSAVPSNDNAVGPRHSTTILGTFRIYLTTTGSLLISLGLSVVNGLMSVAAGVAINPLPPRVPVVVAPLGAFGTLQGVVDGGPASADHHLVQSPDTQMSRLRPDVDSKIARCRNECAKILEMHGIHPSILSRTSWVSIQSLRKRLAEPRVDGKRTPGAGGSLGPSLVWPAVLCFQKLSRTCNQPSFPYEQSWMADPEVFDPLSDAKTWLLGADQREAALARRQKEREAALVRDISGGDGDGRVQSANGYPGITIRRPSNSNAPAVASTMYPTPPDGVQNPVTAAPCVDGTASSPNNQPNAAAAVDVDMTAMAIPHPGQMGGPGGLAGGPAGGPLGGPAGGSSGGPMAGLMGDAFGDSGGWEVPEVKRERQSNSFDGDVDFLGDMGADIFGDNDITDADFSFFDEHPGGGVVGADLDFSGITAMGADMGTGVGTGLDEAVSNPLSFDAFPQKPADNTGSMVLAGRVSASQPPVFTKPELKHARSSLAEDARMVSESERQSRTQVSAGIKRQPSPFNPETVFKRVRASIDTNIGALTARSRQPAARRGSVFEKVDFDPYLALNNKKYQENGRFECRWDTKKENENHKAALVSPSAATMPTAGFLSRHAHGNAHSQGQGQNQRRGKLKELPSNVGALLAKITGDLETSSLQSSPTKMVLDDPASDDDVSLVSDQDDSSYTSDEPSSPTKSIVTTRRRPDDDAISLATSLLREFDNALSPQMPPDLSKFANNDPPELSLARYFGEPEPEPVELQGSFADDDFIMVAQILTEQAASARSLRLTSSAAESEFSNLRETRRNISVCVRQSVQVLQSVLPSSLSGAVECRFRPLIDVQDVPLLGPPSRRPAPPVGVEQMRPNLFQIPTPHLELRRHDVTLSLLPTCVDFWESLALGPSQGPKDVCAVCVFPDWDGMTDHMDNFLDRVENVYESFKLGAFDRLESSIMPDPGLAPYGVDNAPPSPSSGAPPGSGSVVVERMGSLCHELSSSGLEEKNFVVYYVYSPSSPSSIVDCCAAFQRLYELYKKAIASSKRTLTTPTTPSIELVMQLVPLELVASASSLVMPSPADYVGLCLETYDRCTLFDGLMPAPAIVLEQPLPRNIEFKLTATPSTNVLHENSCIHIAYAQSVDERWITAAWTDNRGVKQATASYCLGRRRVGGVGANGRQQQQQQQQRQGQLVTPFAKVAQEIWETTEELISAWRVHWQIIITKCGASMDQSEADLWVGLQQNESRASVSLTLLTVDTDPSLQLVPPPVRLPLAAAAASACYTTPVSTPQASVVSPDQNGGGVGTPATPGGGGGGANEGTTNPVELDPDTALVDITDATWGAVLSHRLSSNTISSSSNNNSNNNNNNNIVNSPGGGGGSGAPPPAAPPLSSSPSSPPSPSPVEMTPALVSGYLVKRGGTRPEDPPVAMEVNVVWTEGNPRLYEALLREILAYFRGLGTLARARGVVDRDTDVRPWHVAAAEKAVQALYQLM